MFRKLQLSVPYLCDQVEKKTMIRNYLSLSYKNYEPIHTLQSKVLADSFYPLV